MLAVLHVAAVLGRDASGGCAPCPRLVTIDLSKLDELTLCAICRGESVPYAAGVLDTLPLSYYSLPPVAGVLATLLVSYYSLPPAAGSKRREAAQSLLERLLTADFDLAVNASGTTSVL